MSNGQRQRGCLVWKRRDWNGTGLGIDTVWHGAGCSLQMFEGLSFGQGIDLLCNVLQDERNMIALEGRKILVNICQSTLIVAILAIIYKPSPCARHSTKLF